MMMVVQIQNHFETVKLGVAMRKAQKDFVDNPTKENLGLVRMAELVFDEAAKQSQALQLAEAA
jgi:hypothetical protein